MNYEILGKLLDLDRHKLFDGKKEVKLEPKIAEVLNYFIQHQNELIAKDKLIDAVWKDQIVTDHSLKRVISKIRDLFNDDPKQPKVIETITNKGYVFIAEVKIPKVKKDKGYEFKRVVPILIIFGLFYLIFLNEAKHIPIYEEKQISSLKGIELDPGYYKDSILFISYIPEKFLFQLNVKNKFNTTTLISEQNILSSAIYDQSRNRIYFGKIIPSYSGIYSYERASQTQKRIIPTAPHKLFSMQLNHDNSILIFTDLNEANRISLFTYDFYKKEINQITFPDSTVIGDSSPIFLNENRILFKRLYRNSKKKIIAIDLIDKKERLVYENPNFEEFTSYDDKHILILETKKQAKSLHIYQLDKQEKALIPVNVNQLQNLRSSYFKKEFLAEKWNFRYQMDIKSATETKRLLETSQSNSQGIFHDEGIVFLSNRAGHYQLFQSKNNTIDQLSEYTFNNRSELYSIGDELFVKSQKNLYRISAMKSTVVDSSVQTFIKGSSIEQSYYLKEKAIYSLSNRIVKALDQKVYNAFVNSNAELYLKYEKDSDIFYNAKTNQSLQITNFTSNDTRRFFLHKRGIYFFSIYKDEALIHFYDFETKRTMLAYELPFEAILINGFSVNDAQTALIYSYLAEQESDIVLMKEVISE